MPTELSKQIREAHALAATQQWTNLSDLLNANAILLADALDRKEEAEALLREAYETLNIYNPTRQVVEDIDAYFKEKR